MDNKQKVKVDLGDLTTYANNAKTDPRYALFEHLFDVHHWDGAAAWSWLETVKDSPEGLTRCPKCDWKGEA